MANRKKFRRGKKGNKNRQSKLTTDFNTSNKVKLIIYKMKIPLLILCLAVVYGTCQTYDEKDHTKAIESKSYNNILII